MKKFLLTTTMVLSAFLFTSETKAQIRLGFNLNLGGGRPSWGLQASAGDYYYMPEIDTYYDIPHRQFIYFQGNNWVTASSLPYQYRDYDLNRGFKVAINENRPYMHGDVYRNRYSSYYNNYHRNDAIAQRRGGDNDRFDNNRGRDDRFGGRREAERNDHFEKGRGNDRNDKGRNDDHNNWGGNNDRNDHGKAPRGRG